MKIALDAMGGDSAPMEPIKGAFLATKELGVEIALVGPEESIRAELGKHPKNDAISVVDAGEAITVPVHHLLHDLGPSLGPSARGRYGERNRGQNGVERRR